MRQAASASAVVVEGVGKRFRKPSDRPMTFKELFVRGLRRTPKEWFWGLSDVSFKVERGSMLGVVGHNGAGKSTLLRLIGGVGLPDQGSIATHGRIGALLELEGGFHPDLSGRDNAMIGGVIAGLTRREVVRRFDEIVAFAELAEFIDAPLRTYSAGMRLRLGFAVAVHTEIDILLIDEVLAVGDLAFQRKCIRRIQDLKASGVAIVLVSHDTDQVKRYCDEALWIDHGKVAAHGPAGGVVEQYVNRMQRINLERTPPQHPALHVRSGRVLRAGENRFGSFELELSDVRLLSASGADVEELASGEPLFVEMTLVPTQAVESPIVLVFIETEDRQLCLETNSADHGLDFGRIAGPVRLRLAIGRLDLTGGRYLVNVSVYERNWSYAYDEHADVYSITIGTKSDVKGLVAAPHRWELVSGPERESA